jgi:outer membrane protein TolC
MLGAAGTGRTADAEVLAIDLPAVMALAGARNLDVQAAVLAADEARAARTSALERFLPSLSPAIASTRHEGTTQAADGTILDVTKTSYTAGLTLAAQVPLGESVYGALQARQLVKAADAATDVQRQDSLLAAVQQYFELVRARAQLAIAREALEVSQSYGRQLEEAVSTGIAFKGDALRVQTQSQRLQIGVQQAEVGQRQAAARLVQILNLDPATVLQPAEAEPRALSVAGVAGSETELLAQALRDRPELVRSAAQVEAATAAHRATTIGPAIPSIGAQAFGGQFGANAGSAGASRDYYLGLNWRIGAGGLFDMGRIRAANARERGVRLGDEKLRAEVARQVVESHAQVVGLREQARLGESAVAAAAETLRLTRDRKQLGVGTVLEDIQAQQELVSARSQWLTAVTELDKAQYALLRALGGLQSGGR